MNPTKGQTYLQARNHSDADKRSEKTEVSRKVPPTTLPRIANDVVHCGALPCLVGTAICETGSKIGSDARAESVLKSNDTGVGVNGGIGMDSVRVSSDGKLLSSCSAWLPTRKPSNNASLLSSSSSSSRKDEDQSWDRDGGMAGCTLVHCDLFLRQSARRQRPKMVGSTLGDENATTWSLGHDTVKRSIIVVSATIIVTETLPCSRRCCRDSIRLCCCGRCRCHCGRCNVSPWSQMLPGRPCPPKEGG